MAQTTSIRDRPTSAATVDRNVELPTRDGKRHRQVDVVLRGRIFGLTDATAAVDCKRWRKPIDVAAVGSFIDLVNDIRADVGLIVSTEGATSGAEDRIREVRQGVRLETMTLNELRAWVPPGTVTTTYRIPADRQDEAETALRNAGFRVVVAANEPPDVLVEAFQYYGTPNPDGKVQRDQSVRAEAALEKLGLDPIHVSGAISISGGTPAHRWLEIAAQGVPTGHRLLAATEAQAGSVSGRVFRDDRQEEGMMDHAATVRRFYGLLSDGDIDGFGDMLADDFVEHEETPGLAPTKDGVLEFFRIERAAFPDMRLDLEDVLVDGDKVVARARMTGTHEGELMGMPPTGKSVNVQLIDIIRFGDDGLAREHWGVFDLMAMMQQLGAVPDGPPV